MNKLTEYLLNVLENNQIIALKRLWMGYGWVQQQSEQIC